MKFFLAFVKLNEVKRCFKNEFAIETECLAQTIVGFVGPKHQTALKQSYK